ncbi:aminocarboxymuconate-semialdehyde decarboxylase [Actinocorallia herbida]|uniref:2-amino-3-carboxymuconate-6-semialdehyde decarboxylase n=1 Tax=Actinocorallia herbida TaxID=58109 RepID=A0A3N1CXL3_9ACTN|nr:amidohydrolase family protein [Actinocorallia herbida]ROO86033.1 aminocarboxymuconate-semialdehyde decarboxylase [Actinocorallia herbida]
MTSSIDVHSHYVPRGWPALPGDEAPRLEVRSEREAMIMVGSKEFRRITAEAWDPEVRLADMDADDVAVQVVSPTPVFFSYGDDPADAAKVSRIFNELALEITDASDRLIPFCQVPLQDTDAACAELERAIADGHAGVEIGNHVGDRDLDDAGIRTFLQHCAALDVPVFVHPWDMPSAPRLDRWMAQWLTGMPAETHLSILSLVLGGVFDDVDPRLRICFAHGGGSFAFWLGRMDNAWRERYDVIGTSIHPPSHYTDRFSVDSVVFTEPSLRLLVDTLGPAQVMVGGDYPYPLGERPVGRVVRDASFLTDPQRTQILRTNAERFLARP